MKILQLKEVIVLVGQVRTLPCFETKREFILALAQHISKHTEEMHWERKDTEEWLPVFRLEPSEN